jgi:type IV secretory pathway VirB2 component (pilin)
VYILLRLSGVTDKFPGFAGKKRFLMKSAKCSLSPFGKRVLIFSICLFAVSTSAFAADDFGLSSKMQTLLDVVSSPWVKAVAAIALIAECIGLITAGRQEPGMFKKFVPWIAGTILFMAASTITSTFLKPEESGINSILEE